MIHRTQRTHLAGALASLLAASLPAVTRAQPTNAQSADEGTIFDLPQPLSTSAQPANTQAVTATLAVFGRATAEAAAQALYDQATAEMDAQRYASACPKLEEVTKLVPDGLGAKLTLAQCYEALGKLASAWSQYALVEALASKAGREERSKEAGQKAAALKPKLATLTIEVPDEVQSIAGLVITRDGLSLGDARWGVPLPVDAGAHEVTATATGRKLWKRSVLVPADGMNVTMKVAAPQIAMTAGRKATDSGGAEAPTRPWQRPLGIGAIVLGGVGAGVGAVLGGRALMKNAESYKDVHCDAQNYCDDTGLALRHEAVGFGNESTAAIVVGAVVLAGGVVLFATAPSAQAQEGRVGVVAGRGSARVELLLGGARLAGRW